MVEPGEGCAERMAAAWGVPVEGGRAGALGIEAVAWRNADPAARHLGADLAPRRLVFSYHPTGIERAEVRLDGRRAFAGRIAPATWMVVPGDVGPEAEVSGRWGLLHVYVPRSAVEAALDAHALRSDLPDLSRCLFGASRPLAGIGRALLSEARGTDRAGALMFDGLAQALVAGLVRAAAPAARSPRATLSPAQRRRLDAFIAAHLGGPITLGALAAEVGLSPAHLCRAFAASYGRPPMREVEARRMARAAARLARGRVSVAEAAAEVGYDDPSHFARAMRRVTGLAPSDWRGR
jgi:AraC family transcriptional regulator